MQPTSGNAPPAWLIRDVDDFVHELLDMEIDDFVRKYANLRKSGPMLPKLSWEDLWTLILVSKLPPT